MQLGIAYGTKRELNPANSKVRLHLFHRAPLLLLFELSAQTLAARVADYVATSGDIAEFEGQIAGASICSIIFQGIAFDVQVTGAQREFHPGNRVFCDSDPASYASLMAIELSDNVKGGEVVAPIIKALLSLTAKIGSTLDARAIYWRPADILSGFPYFAEAVSGYIGGGVFPVLSLIHFDHKPERSAAGTIASKGLGFLCEQEIIFSSGSLPPEEAMRRVVRVAHDLATNGPVTSPIELLGLTAGERLQLQPDRTGRSLAVWITSKMDQ